MPFCENCGAEVSAESKFCRKCGTKQQVTSVAQAEPRDKQARPVETEKVEKGVLGLKFLKKVGEHTLEVNISKLTGRLKIKLDGQELLSKFKFTYITPEIISIDNKRFAVRISGTGVSPNITIEEIAPEKEKFLSITGKLKGFFKEPSHTFDALKDDPLMLAYQYYATIVIIPAVIFSAFMAFVLLVMPSTKLIFRGANPLIALGLFSILFVCYWISFIIFALIGGTVLHIFVYIIGGRKGIKQTIKAVMYGSTPTLLLGWIPLVGIFAGLWSLVLEVIGVRQFHGLTTGRAVASFLLLAVLMALPIVALLPYIGKTPGGTPYQTLQPTQTPIIEVPESVLSVRVMKGAIVGAKVSVYILNADGTKGALLKGPIISDVSGNVDLGLPEQLSAWILVETVGGSYRDEVTGSTITLSDSDVMRAVLHSDQTRAAVTPFTHMAAALAVSSMQQGVLPAAAVTNANTVISRQYNVPILDLMPSAADSKEEIAAASEEQRQYGLLLAGFAQLARDKNVKPIALADALARDWSDGVLNGMQNGNAITLDDISGKKVALTVRTGLDDLQASVNTFIANPNQVTNLKQMAISLAPVSYDPNIATLPVLPSFFPGQEGNFTLGLPEGKPPFRCSLGPSSVMPQWLTLTSDCKISGRAPLLSPGSTKSITPTFVVRITDSSKPPVSKNLTVSITIVESPPSLVPLNTSVCIVNQFCNVSVALGLGGVPPYYFQSDTFRNGAPPMGAIVDLNGFLRGTPKKEGVYRFGVCVVDIVGASDCQQTAVTVGKAVNLTIVWKGAGTGSITWYPETVIPENCGWSSDKTTYRCILPYGSGTYVTVGAEPEDGSTFEGWGGACTGKESCEMTLKQNTQVTVTFQTACDKYPGTKYNPTTDKCECAAGYVWSGTKCQTYQEYCNENYPGTTYNPATNKCEYPSSSQTTTPAPSGGESSVNIQSATCTAIRFSWGTIIYNDVAMSGSASGPVGTYLTLPALGIPTDTPQVASCGEWGSNCRRDSNEPEMTSWEARGSAAVGMRSFSVQAGSAYKQVNLNCPT